MPTFRCRRMAKQMKARGWMLQQDGSFRALDIPGATRAACWKVYHAGLFMLRRLPATPGNSPLKVVTAAVLEEYYERVVKLNAEFPETWEISPASPWIGVYVCSPRFSILGQTCGATFSELLGERWQEDDGRECLEDQHAGARQGYFGWSDRCHQRQPPGQGTSRQAKRRRRDKEDKPRWNWSMTKSSEAGKGSSGASVLQQVGAKKGQPTRKPREGCTCAIRMAARSAMDLRKVPQACPEPCRDQRDHACQICLGRRSNASCPRAPKAGRKAEALGNAGINDPRKRSSWTR